VSVHPKNNSVSSNLDTTNKNVFLCCTIDQNIREQLLSLIDWIKPILSVFCLFDADMKRTNESNGESKPKRQKTVTVPEFNIVPISPLKSHEIQSLIEAEELKRQWLNEHQFVVRYLHELKNKQTEIPVSIDMFCHYRNYRRYQNSTDIDKLSVQRMGIVYGKINNIDSEYIDIHIPKLEQFVIKWHGICHPVNKKDAKTRLNATICSYSSKLEPFIPLDYFKHSIYGFPIRRAIINYNELNENSIYDQEDWNDLMASNNHSEYREHQVWSLYWEFHLWNQVECSHEHHPTESRPPEHTNIQLTFDLFRFILHHLLLNQTCLLTDVCNIVADYACFSVTD
jgi:hypothetical protein